MKRLAILLLAAVPVFAADEHRDPAPSFSADEVRMLFLRIDAQHQREVSELAAQARELERKLYNCRIRRDV